MSNPLKRSKTLSGISKRHMRRVASEISKTDFLTDSSPANEEKCSGSCNENRNWAEMPSAVSVSSSSNVAIHPPEQDNVDGSSNIEGQRDVCREGNERGSPLPFGLYSDSSHSTPSPGCDFVESDNNDSDFVGTIPQKAILDNFLKWNLRRWAVNFNVPHNALSSLLAVLQQHVPNDTLPKDARTLLGTPRTCKVSLLPPGNYCHFGLSRSVILMMTEICKFFATPKTLELLVNVDGLPTSRSSTSSIWPILISDNLLKRVFIVGIYHGPEKPENPNDFLKPFVDEAIHLLNNGLIFKGQLVAVKIVGLICDTPAKSFILRVKGHSGYSSCTKCHIEGVYIENRVCFPDNDAKLRSDEEFLSYADEDFHHGPTILTNIPGFGPVSSTPLDPMHLVYLGVCRKLLNLWLSGPLNVRVGSRVVHLISTQLESISNSIPKEFARRPRSLKYLKVWKATEFRQFVLYSGPIVLRNNLPQRLYEHFLVLHVAISIFTANDSSPAFLAFAKDLLVHFVTCFRILYGTEYMSSNVHGLIHLPADVDNHGALDSFTAFRFENFLQIMKKYIRKSDKPLQQIANRFTEMEEIGHSCSTTPHRCTYSRPHSLGPSLNSLGLGTQYHVLHLENACINCKLDSDCHVLLQDSTVIKVQTVFRSSGNHGFFVGQAMTYISSLYEKPCDSRKLGIWIGKVCGELNAWPISEFRGKVWAVPFEHYYALFPLHH